MMLKTLIGSGNYDFLVLGDFISDVAKLNYEALNEEWVDMFEFFHKSNQVKKLIENYKFRPLLRVKIKLEINYKLEFHVIYTATKLFMEIQTHDSIGDDNAKSFV